MRFAHQKKKMTTTQIKEGTKKVFLKIEKHQACIKALQAKLLYLQTICPHENLRQWDHHDYVGGCDHHKKCDDCGFHEIL